MRSLWKSMAVRWLGGQASETLTRDAALLELLLPDEAAAAPVFAVRRQSPVSHCAMMLRQRQAEAERPETIPDMAAADRGN